MPPTGLVSTTSGAFVLVPGMSLGIVTAGGTFLELSFDVTFTSNILTATGQFRLMVDGVEAIRCGETVAISSFIVEAGVVWRTPLALAAGPHTVDVQWRIAPSGGGANIHVDPLDASGFVQERAQRMVLVVNEVAA